MTKHSIIGTPPNPFRHSGPESQLEGYPFKHDGEQPEETFIPQSIRRTPRAVPPRKKSRAGQSSQSPQTKNTK